jgi:sec-independent protein translocase protein TatA
MGEFSIWHWMVVLLVVLLLFGGGKVSGLMGDLANGIKAFKKNMADEPDASHDAGADKPPGSLSGPPAEAVPRATTRETTAAH